MKCRATERGVEVINLDGIQGASISVTMMTPKSIVIPVFVSEDQKGVSNPPGVCHLATQHVGEQMNTIKWFK